MSAQRYVLADLVAWPVGHDRQEFVKADAYDALVAEQDALAKQVEDQKTWAVQLIKDHKQEIEQLEREVEALTHERDEHRGTAIALERQLAEALALNDLIRKDHAALRDHAESTIAEAQHSLAQLREEHERRGYQLGQAQQRIAELAMYGPPHELLERAKLAEARLQAVTAALIKHGCHDTGCRENSRLEPCWCGYEAALAEATARP